MSFSTPDTNRNRLNSLQPDPGAEISNFEEARLTTDSASINTMDQISTARPAVTMLDKLWTQIDVLDDVRSMAQEVQEKGSFLGAEFNARLQAMKEAQLKLLELMKKQELLSEQARQTRADLREEQVQGPFKQEDIERDLEIKQKRMQDFFFSQGNNENSTKQRKREFEELNDHVLDVRSNLDQVARSMADFEDATKDLW